MCNCLWLVLILIPQYDSEFIQWYGLKINEAVQKMEFESEKAAGPPQPLKALYRLEFLEELKQAETKWVKSHQNLTYWLLFILTSNSNNALFVSISFLIRQEEEKEEFTPANRIASMISKLNPFKKSK